MDSIVQFFLSFGQYAKDANILWTVLTPLLTLVAIYLFTIGGLSISVKKYKFKRVFLIHKSLIISSLLVAMVLVATLCYNWSKNLFAESHLELAFLISLLLSFVVPIVSFAVLRGYWEKTRVNEIVEQPISAEQARNNIPFINKAFNENKIWYLLPLIGFLFLLFSLNRGTNLISVVYDNSTSMDGNNAIDALSKTFESLDKNNEIIFTNLNNNQSQLDNCKRTLQDIFAIKQSSTIKAGLCSIYDTPESAKQNFQSTFAESLGSPICEVIWKMWLFTKEYKGNNEYKNKLLIVITDGDDLIVKDDLKRNSKFLFDNIEFAEYYTPDNTHIIDYSEGGDGIVIKKFEESGAIVYPAVASVDDYLSALDDALLSFQNNIYLIIWVIVICALGTIIGLIITPKKITI
jgi:hypothetical protein